MGSALGHIILARLREPLRQPETVFWIFLFPALLALALGIAFRDHTPAATPVAVTTGPGAEKVAAGLRRDPLLTVAVLAPAAAEQQLRRGQVAVVVVPGEPVGYRFDPSRPESRLARAQVDAALQRAAGRRDPRTTRELHVTTPGSRYIDFLIPGLLGMNLMGGGLWGLGWAIVEARTRKLLRRLLATPMRRRDYLLGHMLARMAFVPLEVVTLLLFAWLIFDVQVAGSLVALSVVVLLGSLSFAGLGTLLASRARTLETMSGLVNLASLPMMLLSGVFFSISRFPEEIQPFIRALPLTALNEALRGIINDGASLFSLGPQILLLVAWGAVSFFIALRLFRWT